MKRKNLKLEIKFWGSILQCKVLLENIPIGMWAYNSKNKYYFKDLPDYEIDGNLDTELKIRGKNGGSATLIIKIEGQNEERLTSIIQNGKGISRKSIDINN